MAATSEGGRVYVQSGCLGTGCGKKAAAGDPERFGLRRLFRPWWCRGQKPPIICIDRLARRATLDVVRWPMTRGNAALRSRRIAIGALCLVLCMSVFSCRQEQAGSTKGTPNWSAMKEGMTQDQVRAVLGEPVLVQPEMENRAS
ncbi:MAG: outer membrane protein assembly factor BamE domain-containing protein [Phycisphaerae bacterium]